MGTRKYLSADGLIQIVQQSIMQEKVKELKQSNRPAEPPRQPLTQQYVNLSIHTAVVKQNF